jgi:hypothetical protein
MIAANDCAELGGACGQFRNQERKIVTGRMQPR